MYLLFFQGAVASVMGDSKAPISEEPLKKTGDAVLVALKPSDRTQILVQHLTSATYGPIADILGAKTVDQLIPKDQLLVVLFPEYTVQAVLNVCELYWAMTYTSTAVYNLV